MASLSHASCLVLPFLLLALTAAASDQSLQFATIVTVDGCPLSVYFSGGSKGKEAFLAPAFCITQDAESIMASTSPKFDSILNASFLTIKVAMSEQRLLQEAKKELKSFLGRRKLSFFELLDAVELADSWQQPVMVWEQQNDTTVPLLRILCKTPDCGDLYTQFYAGRWALIEELELTLTLGIPRSTSLPIQMRVPLSVANQSRSLKAPLLQVPKCRAAVNAMSLMHNDQCRLTVVQLDDRKRNFEIEPMLCYFNDLVSEFDENGGTVTLSLQVKNDSVLASVKQKLLFYRPKSVQFMSLISVGLTVSKPLSQWKFYAPRLSPDGEKVKLKIGCQTGATCRNLLSSVKQQPSHLWSHLSFSVQAQSGSSCVWYSQKKSISVQQDSPSPTRTFVGQSYHEVNGTACIKSEFTKSHRYLSAKLCAVMCDRSDKCQAYRTDSDLCRLFLFDKCSRNFTVPGCRDAARVFVKKQSGLEPGSLCPAGYGNEFMGMKYKLYAAPGSWSDARQQCESQSGLVTMADIFDAREMRHVAQLYMRQGLGSVWLGGYQAPGSAEPSGGWRWAGCNASVDSRLWPYGEPNNYDGIEHVTEMGLWYRSQINDASSNLTTVKGYLCKCVSPFGV